MSARNVIRWSLAVVLIGGSVVQGQGWPPNRAPLPQGQDITTRDGDRIIIEDDARVRIVRRRQGMVRTVFNPSQRLLIVLIDYAKPGEAPDGLVDMAYNYREVEGDWPLGERWEGFVAFEEYLPASYPSSVRFALVTPNGVVQLKSSGAPEQEPRDPSVIAVLAFRGSGGRGASLPGLSFDQAEQQQVAEAARNAEVQGGVNQPGSGAGGFVFSSSSGFTWESGGGPIRGGLQAGAAKIHDVPPVYPEEARQANVRGVVILEIAVGADGSVTNARVLRSIPMLDAAALEAVRQWRYAPTLVNGQAVPVVITVTVPFPPKPTP